jgi:hypothetical protein
MKLPIHLPDPATLLSELPRPHKPTPMSELSWPRRIRRGFGLVMLVSMGAMAVSASTASTDWDVRGDGPPPAQKPKDEDDSADGPDDDANRVSETDSEDTSDATA